MRRSEELKSPPQQPLSEDATHQADEATIVEGSSTPRLNLAKAATLVAGVTVGMISNIAAAAIFISVPTIGIELHVPDDQLQWPAAAYSLTSGCFLLLFGRLADLYGRKRAFFVGMLWFIIWAIACGFAQNLAQLSVFRALQGMGSAATVPASIGILAAAFPPGRARSFAFATFSCGAPIGGSVGTLLGGTLTQYAPTTWRASFYVNAALAALALISVLLVAPHDVYEAKADRRVDWIGAGMVTVALVLLTFVLSEGEASKNGWATPHIIALLVISLAALGAFIAWEYYVENQTTRPPLMRLTLWKRANGQFAAVQAVGFFAWIAFNSWIYWATLYYQRYLGLSPVQAMVRMIPMFVSGALCNLFVALVVARVSGAILLGVGAAATGSAGLLFALIIPSAPYWAFGFPAAALVVFGADFIFATGSLFVAKVALPHEQSLAGGVFNTLMQLGSAVGLSITTVVSNRVTRKKASDLGVVIDPKDPSSIPLPALLAGYRAAQWTSFGFAVFSVGLIVVFLRGIGKVGSKAPAPTSESTQQNISPDSPIMEDRKEDSV